MIKKVKLMKGAFIEVNFDEKKGEIGTYINFDGSVGNLFSGYLYRCKNCGKFVFKSNYAGRPKLNFCDECLETMKITFGVSQLKESRVEETKDNLEGAFVSKHENTQKRGRIRKSYVRNAKVSIVVPEIQNYVDLLVDMRQNTRTYNKKFLLVILDMIARKKTRKEMAEVLGICDHTMYCYLHDMRKVALIDTKDLETYTILPTYYIKEEN